MFIIVCRVRVCVCVQVVAMIKELLETRIRPAVQVRNATHTHTDTHTHTHSCKGDSLLAWVQGPFPACILCVCVCVGGRG